MRLKQKAEEEAAFQKKASISIPLVEEHSDDVTMAKEISFSSSDLAQQIRRKRLEIESQSVFDSTSSPSTSEPWAKDREGLKRARALLVEACSKTRKGSSPSASTSAHSKLLCSLVTKRTSIGRT